MIKRTVKMTQYCRYCNNLVTGNGIYCERKETELSEAYTKRTNKCKLFEFNPMDAYEFDRMYRPRQKKQKSQPLEYYDSFDFEARSDTP